MEVNELRGIVIKLFYHTLALLHFTFFFISQTLPSGWVKNMLFLPHFKFLSFNIKIVFGKNNRSIQLKKTCYIDFAYFSNRLCKINLFFCFIFFSLHVFLCLQFFSSKSFVVAGSKGIVLCQKRCICCRHKQHICFAHARIQQLSLQAI